MEILGFSFSNQEDEKYIRDLLAVFDIVYIDQKISNIVVDIRKKKRIKLPDAIIAATAIYLGFQFVTRNVSDFENLNLKIINPFD